MVNQQCRPLYVTCSEPDLETGKRVFQNGICAQCGMKRSKHTFERCGAKLHATDKNGKHKKCKKILVYQTENEEGRSVWHLCGKCERTHDKTR